MDKLILVLERYILTTYPPFPFGCHYFHVPYSLHIPKGETEKSLILDGLINVNSMFMVKLKTSITRLYIYKVSVYLLPSRMREIYLIFIGISNIWCLREDCHDSSETLNIVCISWSICQQIERNILDVQDILYSR